MRIVIKVGSQVLTNPDHSLNTVFIAHIVEQMAALFRAGHQTLLVTSGAVAAGRHTICIRKENKNIPYRQALAAVGQTFLLQTYRDEFAKHGMVIGQVLLTMIDFKQHPHFLSTSSTLELLLQSNVIPIINENDVTTFSETKFGNNDKLSALVASMMRADTLILLTDVEGFYSNDPKKDPDAKLLKTIGTITPAMKTAAKPTGTGKGIGGMYEKVLAAEYANAAGVNVWIARGTIPQVVTDLILEGKHHGTLFKTTVSSQNARRRWMQTRLVRNTGLVLDAGASDALLKKGKSLLPSGITAVEGGFKRGDVVSIIDAQGRVLGYGQVNYPSDEVERIKGKHSRDIAAELGYAGDEVVIHRDNLVITA